MWLCHPETNQPEKAGGTSSAESRPQGEAPGAVVATNTALDPVARRFAWGA